MASENKPHVPIVKSRAIKTDNVKTHDEVMKKFSKNFRKLLESRENVPGNGTPKAVSFNPQTVETSFGGSQTPGKIKDTSVHLDFSVVDAKLKAQKSSESEEKGSKTKSQRPSSAGSTKTKSSDGKIEKRQSSKDRSMPLSKDQNTPASKAAKTNGHLPNQFKHGSASKPAIKITEPKLRPATVNQLNGSGDSSVLSTSIAVTPDRRHTLDPLKDFTHSNTPDCFNPVSFETPGSKLRYSSGDVSMTRDDHDSSSMTVAVRVRPYSSREVALDECKCVVSMVDNQTTVRHSDKNSAADVHRFAYDYSFWSFDKKGGVYADQEYVYSTLAQPMLAKAFEGYNTCLFAYGQTGSGKSYSIMGHGDEVGIIPRFCEELFGRIDAGIHEVYPSQAKFNTNVEISFFEIYNEKIHDLLGPSTKDKTTGRRPHLKVREHPVLGPYVEGLSSYVVKSFEDIKSWLSVGNKHRATAATGMNDKSSRSHSVFTMVMTQTRIDTIEGTEHEHSITSKINLVDLAGSERQSLAKTSGDRLREGASINKSLHTLGKVISLLSEQTTSSYQLRKKKLFIPYRDSVLTWLLKESLGGNSKTAMLATISPAQCHIEETLSTLRYARQARSIINSAKVNEDPKARLIRELKQEIERLKNQTTVGGGSDNDVIGASLAEIATLRTKLTQKELEMNEMTRSWQERLKKSEERKIEESRLLEKSGIALKIDNQLPNLVNLNEDPQLSEMLLYVLREGESRVGRMVETSDADIQLNGPLIADNHCTMKNTGKKVIILPQGDAPTYVNGDLITSDTVLHHGDRVILGGDHYFRFNHPIEVQQGRKSSGLSSQPKDFEFARQELIRVQNARYV